MPEPRNLKIVITPAAAAELGRACAKIAELVTPEVQAHLDQMHADPRLRKRWDHVRINDMAAMLHALGPRSVPPARRSQHDAGRRARPREHRRQSARAPSRRDDDDDPHDLRVVPAEQFWADVDRWLERSDVA